MPIIDMRTGKVLVTDEQLIKDFKRWISSMTREKLAEMVEELIKEEEGRNGGMVGIKHSKQVMRRRNKGKYRGKKRILDDAKLYKLHKRGMSNWDISKIMDCDLETVERHLRKIKEE